MFFSKLRTRGKSLFGGQVDTGFPILADPFDTESVATGMVLATLQLDRERTRTREREKERERDCEREKRER